MIIWGVQNKMADEFDNQDPKGKNSLNSKELFKQREIYRDLAYPDDLPDIPQPIDVWYNKFLYGKVDPEGNAVFLNEDMLKKLPSEEGDIFALNFVVDAFEDLQNYMAVAANRGKISTEDSKYFPVEPKRGWTSVQNRYFEHIDAIYQAFTSTYLGLKENNKKLVTFKDFMDIFWTYIKEIQPDFPFTRTGFIMSHYCPIATTGLVVEVSDDDHGDDEIKFEDFINDDNFFFFVAAARRFGFRVDKNAPWRLIADVKSETMQDYMSRYPEPPPEPAASGSMPTLPDACTMFGKYCNELVTVDGKPGGQITEIISRTNTDAAKFEISPAVIEGGDLEGSRRGAAGLAAVGHITLPEWENSTHPPSYRGGNKWLEEDPQGDGPAYEFPHNIPTVTIVVVKNDFGAVEFVEIPTGLSPAAKAARMEKSGNYAWVNPYRSPYSEDGGKLILDASDSSGGAVAYLWEILNLENFGNRVGPFEARGSSVVDSKYYNWEGDDLALSHNGWSTNPTVTVSGLTEPGDYILRLRVRNNDAIESTAEYFKIRIWDLGNYEDSDYPLTQLPEIPELDSARTANRTQDMPGLRAGVGTNRRGWTDRWHNRDITAFDPIHSRPMGYLNLSRDSEVNVAASNMINGTTNPLLFGYPGPILQNFMNTSIYNNVGSPEGDVYIQYPGYTELGDQAGRARSRGPLSIYSGQNGDNDAIPPETLNKLRWGVEVDDLFRTIWRTTHGNGINTNISLLQLVFNARAHSAVADNSEDEFIGKNPMYSITDNLIATARMKALGTLFDTRTSPRRHQIPVDLLPKPLPSQRDQLRISESNWQDRPPYWDPYQLYHVLDWLKDLAKNASNISRRFRAGPSEARFNFGGAQISSGGQYFQRGDKIGICKTAKGAKVFEGNVCEDWIDGIFDLILHEYGAGFTNPVNVNGEVVTLNFEQQMPIVIPVDSNEERGAFGETYLIENFDFIWHRDPSFDPSNPPFNPPISSPRALPIFNSQIQTPIIIDPTTNTTVAQIILSMGDDNAFQEDRREFNRLVQKTPLDIVAWQERKNVYDQYVVARGGWAQLPRLEFSNLFTQEYLKSFELDIQTLKVYTLDFFNSYVINNPSVTRTKLNECGDGTVSYVMKRKLITQDEMDIQYSDAYWIKFYASLRMLESGLTLDKFAVEKFFNHVKNLLAARPGNVGLQRVLRTIAEDTKSVFKEKLLLTPPAKDDKIKTDSDDQPTTIQDVLNHIKNNDELI